MVLVATVTLAAIDDEIAIHHEPDPEPTIVEGPATRAHAHPVQAALAILAAIIAGFAVFLFAGSGFLGQRDQVIRDRELRSQLAMGKARIGGVIPLGTPIAIVNLPDIGIRQVVAEGTTAEVTEGGAGHVRATPLPGQAGNAVLIARRSTFGAPFRNIDSLRAGDPITVVTGQGRARYRVTGVTTAASDDPTIFATTSRQARLTLLTADPPLAPTRYLVARATLVGTPAASTPHARVVTRSETGLVGQASDLGLLALGLVLLLATGALGTWLFLRWRPWSAYIVVVPVVLAGSWFTFATAARLLPAAL